MQNKVYLFLAVVTLLMTDIVNAQTTAFKYQGKLTDGVMAANGTYNMQFRLYGSLAGVDLIGSIPSTPVTVTNGVFTVPLDFGAGAFPTASLRWLEIQVESTTLTPRQQITSSPYAIRTLSSNAADSLSAMCITCVTDAQISSIDGSKLTGTVVDARLSSNVVLLTATQTLTNKTIDSTTNTVTTDKLRTATTVVDVKSSAAPIAGQVLTATNSTTATWQTPVVPTVHFIGESYGGGIVFYVYDNGQHGLIAATADQNGGATIRWGFSYTNTRAKADGVGAGLKNTAIIVANQGPVATMPPNSPFAATVCNEYSVTVGGVTYGDWYLPSKHELNLLYLQRNVVGGFVPGYYWSSTEFLSDWAWYQDFLSGGQGPTGDKFTDNSDRVRAIRAF